MSTRLQGARAALLGEHGRQHGSFLGRHGALPGRQQPKIGVVELYETERLLRPYRLGRDNKYSYCAAHLNASYCYSKLRFKR
jgi:hypothetical protein